VSPTDRSDLFVLCGWHGTIAEFLGVEEMVWLRLLSRHCRSLMNKEPEQSQVTAWRESYRLLRRELPPLLDHRPDAAIWTLVFEYELSLDFRRTDLIVLAGASIIVVEFKGADHVEPAYLDQLRGYARDLLYYHQPSYGHVVSQLLVLTHWAGPSSRHGKAYVIGPQRLAAAFRYLGTRDTGITIDPDYWLSTWGTPLPHLVQAARQLFRDEPLPQIKRAESAGIPQVVAALEAITLQARAEHGIHLAIVTGVPGSGKTLVGLDLVHRTRGDPAAPDAIYLTHNDWLVAVLVHMLGNSAFIHYVSGFLSRFLNEPGLRPMADIWVFDEAQRALDAARAKKAQGRDLSDPDAFLAIANRHTKGVTLVLLVGEGQEIYYGEEEGIDAWDRAIATISQPVTVHCAPRLQSVFPHAVQIEPNPRFDLTTSLRSHLAEDLHLWVNHFLNGEIPQARRAAERARTQGFAMYVSGSMDAAKAYVRQRYPGQRTKRYGIIAPQKASWSHSLDWGVDNTLDAARHLKLDRWFNDPPESKYSCCQLWNAAVDFQVQGLELDFAIIPWGDDLYWRHGVWHLSQWVRMDNAGDNRQLRINNYRVLLTRSRDGFVILVPKRWKTFGLFLSAGLVELSEGAEPAVEPLGTSL
jgi:hypothetical protein